MEVEIRVDRSRRTNLLCCHEAGLLQTADLSSDRLLGNSGASSEFGTGKRTRAAEDFGEESHLVLGPKHREQSGRGLSHSHTLTTLRVDLPEVWVNRTYELWRPSERLVGQAGPC
jgi:hypothetical protein